MLARRDTVRLALAGLLTLRPPAHASSIPASERLNQPGPEAARLAARTGRWAVTETAWANPGAAPVTTTGLVADRLMIGNLLQETLLPSGPGGARDACRTDLLSFDRLEGRWDYVSFDARGPDGIMVAFSRGSGDDGTIALDFMPFATPRPGPDAVGQFLRMDQVIRFDDEHHDTKEQFFMLADGSGARWLGHRYVYARIATGGAAPAPQPGAGPQDRRY